MTIQYASDLHLEMHDNELFLGNEPLKPMADVLVLAGDIIPFGLVDQYDFFFDYLSASFKIVYWIAGNHEYYHYDLAKKRGTFVEHIRSNIFLVNDHAATIGNVRLIFATMWTSIQPRNRLAIEMGMNDFYLIRYSGERLTVDNLEQEHKTSLAFIEYELLQSLPGVKKMVVTHHVPTFIHYPKKYLGSALNQAFAVELKDLISASGPNYWLYGHHHQNMAPFKIGNTTLITNQLGYVRQNEHLHFDEGKVLEF